MIPLVYQKLRLNQSQLKTGDLGVEQEVEGVNLPHLDTAVWRSERDHSLRGECKEYVMRNPMTLEETKTAVNELLNHFQGGNSQFVESVRAGVHVHLNVQEINVVELYNLIFLYYCVEDILLDFCGPTRKGNLFCLGLSHSEYTADVIGNALKRKDLTVFSDEVIRYSALNLCSLSKYGSVEFRAMRSANDVQLINTWCEIIHNLRDVACSYNNPKEILEEAISNYPELLSKVFPSTLNLSFVNYSQAAPKDNNLDLIEPLIRFTDWDSFKEKLIGGESFPIDVEFPDEPLGDA